MPKSPVAFIELNRLDGKRSELGVKHFDTWALANAALVEMRKTAPVTDVHEVDFTIGWATGAHYSGILSLTYSARSTYDLAARIRYTIEVVAGVRQPKHLTELEYTMALAKVPAETRALWADFVQAHDLGTAKAAGKAEAAVGADEVLSWLQVKKVEQVEVSKSPPTVI